MQTNHTISHHGAASYNKKTVLVTGANGFVAGYLGDFLANAGAVLHGLDIHASGVHPQYEYHTCNLTDPIVVSNTIHSIRPDIVFHLASKASVGSSWEAEWETIDLNGKSSYTLLHTLEAEKKPVRVLLVSSGEVYGDVGTRPAHVSDPMRPVNPYAISKTLMECIAFRFRSSAVQWIIARAFTHTGKGRPLCYFESSVAKQFAEAQTSGKRCFDLLVGNIDITRDYSAVQEVVEKYAWLGALGTPGQIYNVCSGNGIQLRQIIAFYEELSGITAVVHQDQSRMRKNEIPFLVGENTLSGTFPKANERLFEALKALYTSICSESI